ncbi:type VII secretion target [Nocardia alni]|uniref:type VII secretion target n=1 Tax=Nocardia alni TaxID=2815723 RepID=UPI001C221503|nr:type VII secretion target [Nocardia alni]
MTEELTAHPDRMRKLAGTFHSVAGEMDGITTGLHTPEVSGSLMDSATSEACDAIGQAAHELIGNVTGEYRAMHVAATISADVYERADTEFARQIRSVTEGIR